MLIGMINAQNQGGNVGPAISPVINNTQLIYTTDNDYAETIDGVIVTHLTVQVVQAFLERLQRVGELLSAIDDTMGESLTSLEPFSLFKLISSNSSKTMCLLEIG